MLQRWNKDDTELNLKRENIAFSDWKPLRVITCTIKVWGGKFDCMSFSSFKRLLCQLASEINGLAGKVDNFHKGDQRCCCCCRCCTWSELFPRPRQVPEITPPPGLGAGRGAACGERFLRFTASQTKTHSYQHFREKKKFPEAFRSRLATFDCMDLIIVFLHAFCFLSELTL